MKTLAELQAECTALGIEVTTNGRPSKEPWIKALRLQHWEQENPGQPLPEQMEPMLLADWNDLTPEEAEAIENDHHAWCVQPKLDGVRVLLHIEVGQVRITGRTVSEVTYRLSEHQDNLPHLGKGLESLAGTILDGELVCPTGKIDTGKTVTANPLQAAVAILATTPENAKRIQDEHEAHLELHVFDVLRHTGQDVTIQPLAERLSLLARIMDQIGNPFIQIVPTGIVGKRAIHDRVLLNGGEGTVWKWLDRPYEPGRRVNHWIKRKRETNIEAFVSDYKPGSPGRGNGHLIGAVEFSVRESSGKTRPIAWVSNWTDEERHRMTIHSQGTVTLDANYYGKKAVLRGQDLSAKSGRVRHARIVRWCESDAQEAKGVAVSPQDNFAVLTA